MKFLSDTGLSHFWDKIKTYISNNTGKGDMLKDTYDTNENGIVDNAEKVNGHTVEIDVPENAQLTDTTNYEQFTNKPQINNVELSGNKTLDELGIQEKGNYALQEAVDAIEGQVQETENTIDNLSDSINNLSNTTNELNNKIDKIVLKSLSDIGLSEFTTLDAIVTAVPNGKTLQLYLSDDNASTLYGTSGGTGNLPTNIAGLLTVQRNSENNWVYITYKTNLSVFENENAGIFYATKFTGYRDWVKVLCNSDVQDGTPSPTGRKIGGKDEYFVEKQITTPAVNDNFSTVFAFTQDVTVHEMSNMIFPNGFDDDQYPDKTPFEYLFRHGTGVIARVISENSWWANRTAIIRMYFTYNE